MNVNSKHFRSFTITLLSQRTLRARELWVFCHLCETFYTITQSNTNILVRDHKLLRGQFHCTEKLGGRGSANWIFLTFGVVTLSPVVSSAGLAEHEIVGSEDLTEGAGPHAVHGAGLQVHQHCLQGFIFYTFMWELFGVYTVIVTIFVLW